MLKVGTIKEIWRYPVKGMAGEQLNSCSLGKMGLSGDRIWALRDSLRREIQSCKFRPELLLCSACFRDGDRATSHNQVDVEFPDGSILGSDDIAIHSKLSELTGRASTLESLRPASDQDFYRRHKQDDHTWLEELKATFDREQGEALPEFFGDLPQAAVDYVSLLGSFFLVTPFHLVTTATLAHLRRINPSSDWDTRRFRPNVLIETDADAQGLVEQDWVGKSLRLGAAAIDCNGTTPRCGAITRAQRDFAADKSLLRTVVKEADQNVGVYGAITHVGEVCVGDAVYLDKASL